MTAIETYATEGTAALDIRRTWTSLSSSDLEVVTGGAGRKAKHARGAHAAAPKGFGERAASAFRDVLDSSEMYCSLKYEDFHGCPYGVFTRKGIAALSSASACVAVLSIAFGA